MQGLSLWGQLQYNSSHFMNSRSHAAAGPAAGFVYQFERALNWLAQKPAGTYVGIETADDIEICTPNGASILEQDKHSLSGEAQPFGNRAKGLWNTLAIWIEAIESGQRSIDSTSFLMVTNQTVPDCIARHIANATSSIEIDACIVDLQTSAANPPKHLAKLMDRVLATSSVSTLQNVIRQTGLADASEATCAAALRTETVAHLQIPEWYSKQVDSIVNELLGWLQTTVISSWRRNEAGWIQRDHFVNELHAVLERRKRQIVRERTELLIPVTDETVGQEKERGRPFVQQLHLICEDETIVTTAIREFIRCNIEKSRLSKEGDITDEDWEAFEKSLTSRWEKIRSRVLRMRNDTREPDIGFEIFSETTEDYREKLAGRDTEQVYLTSGTYHRLADLLRVGWHPQYKALLNELLGGK